MTELTGLKRCPCVGHEGPNPLPTSDFYRNIRSPDGLHFWCRVCVDRTIARQTSAIKKAIFGYYGESCVCCGSTSDLTIDHTNGNGTEHRLELFGGKGNAKNMYRWLIANAFPDGFQVMCRACNASKRSGPSCRLDHNTPDGFKTCRSSQHDGPNPLPLGAFGKDVTKRDGRTLWCRVCRNRAVRTIWSKVQSN